LKAAIIRPKPRPTEEFRRRGDAARRALLGGAALAAGLAAGIAKPDSLRIVPTVAVTESYSDNVALVAGDLARSGWVTQVAPRFRADLSGARMKGFFDYRLDYTAFSSASRLNGTQRFLNSFAKVEAIEKRLFVDMRADISNQNRSVFGAAVTPGLSTPSANRIETTSYQVAPYTRGQVADIARYQLRLVESRVRANDAALPDASTTEWVGRMTNAAPSAKLGWAVDADALSLRTGASGTLADSRIRGSFIYALNPQMHLYATAGRETTDFAGPPRRATNTRGVGLEWSPSVRTQLSALHEKRFFGDGRSVVFSHRTPLTAWRLVSTKDAAVLPAQLAAGNTTSIESLMSDLLASAIPDPDARAAAVRRRLDETGITGTSALNSNFLSARPFVFRNDVASFALLGAINTMALMFTRREQRSFGASLAGGGSVGDEDFRQTGFDANLAHRLSPRTTLTLTATTLRTEGLTATASRSRQHLYSVFLSNRVGPKTTASFGFRRVDFDGSTALESYRGNAIFGSVAIRL
jgi:uncharacterized protein (PEP-CTERM system associated)